MATDIADLGVRVDSRGFVTATKDMDGYRKAASQAETTSQRLARQMDELGGKMQGVGRSATLRLTAPLVAMAGAGVMAFSRFDDAMTQSLAIMGDVSDEMRDEMSRAARDMAKETVFSATQAAESYFFLASAGLDAEKSIAALPQVAKFAQAGMFDMATATDLATDAQSALRLTSDDAAKNLENLTRVTDVLVGANTIANASVEQFASSLTNRAGSAMAQLNIELEEGVAVLAAWADQGIKGNRAGEQFNIVTREMERAVRNNADEWERLNVSVFDSEGNFRSMADIIGGLETALDGMSTEQQGATLEMLGFQSESIAAIRPLIGLSDNIRNYTEQLREMGGVTDEVANNQLQSFSAQMGLTKDRITDIFITIGEALVPVLQDLNDEANGIIPKIAELAEKFRDADSTTKNLVIGITALVAALGPLLIILGTMIRAFGTIISLLRVTRALVLSMTGAFLGVGLAIAGSAVALERKFVPGMEKVGVMEQVVNVLTRAWVILRETLMGVGEVALGLAVTVVGAIRAIISPIEGIVRSAATAMQALIDKDLKGARDAVMGIGDEIVQANARAREQMENGVGFMTQSISSRVRTAIEEVNTLRTEMMDTAATAAEIGDGADKGLGMLSSGVSMMLATFETLNAGAAETTETIARTGGALGEASEKAEEFDQRLRDQVDALRRQKLELQGGSRAVLMYELAQIKAAGATEEQVRELEKLIDEVVRAEDELEAMERRLQSAGENFMGMGTAIETAMELMREELAKSEDAMIQLENTALRGLDRMTQAFSAFITGEIESFSDFADQLGQIMQQTMTDMVSQMAKNRMSGAQTGGMTQMEGFGLVGMMGSIAGQAIGGGLGAGISGAAAGASLGATVGSVIPVIGTAVGAIVGAILGGAAGYFGGEDPPAFRLGGEGTYGGSQRFQSPRTEMFESELGVFYANFRRLQDSQERKIVDAVMKFDQQIAELLSEEQIEIASAALQGFDWDQQKGADTEGLIRARFETILGTFDDFTQEMVLRENGLEDQMQAFAEVLKMKELAEAGDVIANLGFEELVLTMSELGRAGETLGETYGRVLQQFQEYAKISGDLQTMALTDGLTGFQQEMVDVQLEGLRMAESLRQAADAAGLEAARSEDLARVHELTANRMAAVIGRMEEAGRGLVEDLFGTELTRLQDEIAAAREAGAEDQDIAGLLQRQEELRAEEEQRQRVQQARELSQIIADMAQASGDSFEDVATRLGTNLEQLGGVLGLGEDKLAQMLEDMQIDPMALATEIQGMTEKIVDELALLPGAFADALFNARNREEDPPVNGPQQPPGDGGGGGGGPPGDGGFLDPNSIGSITQSTSATTEAVKDLDGNVVELIGNQQQVSANVAAALNNLASAIRAQNRDRAGEPRSSRTRTDVA